MTESDAADRTQAILVLIATFAMIGFNFLAASGLVNGVTPEEISNKYPTVVTPAGYAFSIWSLIYAGLIAFSIYQILPSNAARFRGVRSLYILSSALNCAWLFFWHYGQVLVGFVIILALVVVLYFINRSLRMTEGPGEYWLAKAPFSIYFGWVTAATLVNFAVLLAYLNIGLSNSSVAVALIALTAVLGVWARVKLNNDLYPLAVAWALTAIAVKQSGQTAIVVACAAGVVANLIASLSFVVNLPSRTTSTSTAK